MSATIQAALGLSEYSDDVQFVTLVIIGAAAGWCLAQPRYWCAWTASLAIMGVCGAWMGAEAAYLFGQVDRGGVSQLLAAALGAAALAWSWRRVQRPARPSDSDDIAIHGTRA